jgi:hypothetical protein
MAKTAERKNSLPTASNQHPEVSTSTEEGTIVERRRRWVNASAEQVYSNISQLGGDKGWPALNWAWQVRGWIDKMRLGHGHAWIAEPAAETCDRL